MSTSEKPQPARLPYEKPTVQSLDLAADEVMAANCKIPSRSGPGAALCMRLGVPCQGGGS